MADSAFPMRDSTFLDDDGAADDVALMAAFAGGDVDAFARLYERHEAALYRFVRRLLGRSAATQADEVFQDTWMRVLQAKDRYRARDGAQFRTWLFTLAHHRALDVLRRSGREQSLPEGDEAEPFEPTGVPWTHWPRPDEAIDNIVFWRRAGARLLDCLEQLPTAQRATFLLHHEDGIALDEIARALEVGFETAKSRLRYAMSKLRGCMGAYLDAAKLGARP
ncbi:MAG: sigma-70 family RNA polymerase sigma factor [Burkholderiaceae bacterium]